MSVIQEFFAPIPLWFVAVITLVSLGLGMLLCMPQKWAERFFRMMSGFFKS